MAEKTFTFVYTMSHVLGSVSDYSMTMMSAFYPVKSLMDGADGADDGVVLDGAPLTLYLSPLTFGVTLLGIDGNGDVAVTNGTTIYFLSNDNYSPGHVTTLSDQTLTMCFAAGTAIAGPRGETAVEALTIGDLITTSDGKAVPVKWVGRKELHKLWAGPNMQPVRFRAGSLGDGLPHSDLTVTADHGMIVDDLVINAAALVNGDNIDWVPMDELPDLVTYYHIETENHDVILANGAKAETFVDMSDRAAFDNHQQYLDLYGAERLIQEMDRPRIATQRLVPEAIKARFGIDDGFADFEIALTA